MRVEHVMGTAISVDIRDLPSPDEAMDAVFAWLRWVDVTFSTYREGSEISRLGRGELKASDCSPEVRLVLDACERLRELTDGYFDAHAGAALDPSGFVKGWSVEVASSILVERGSVNHCINAGGDVRVRGVPDDARMWNIGVVHPADRTALTTVVTARDVGVATSGTAERGEHVFDPHTGVAATELASVTIVGPELAYTDAYATAAFAMGTRATEWLSRLEGHESYVVDAGGFAWWTPGFVRHAPGIDSSGCARL